ncbi:hypothetical protein CEXT_92111 [Caerostris extrusa]|uniref:Peptidase A2 domain-containing protein n=1 Tax=Caerostris extrusa TaxID=172846 RepID=A0AAV4WIN0_CAEEX|nr:hypothetical protein CEXT_92111 [Caerostris extrusa]
MRKGFDLEFQRIIDSGAKTTVFRKSVILKDLLQLSSENIFNGPPVGAKLASVPLRLWADKDILWPFVQERKEESTLGKTMQNIWYSNRRKGLRYTNQEHFGTSDNQVVLPKCAIAASITLLLEKEDLMTRIHSLATLLLAFFNLTLKYNRVKSAPKVFLEDSITILSSVDHWTYIVGTGSQMYAP